MKRTVDVEEIIWDSLTLSAREMGYDSRNHLVSEILKTFVLSQPGLQERAASITYEKMEMKQADQPWKPTIMPPVSEDDLKEIFGDDLDGFGDSGVLSKPVGDEPELPEL